MSEEYKCVWCGKAFPTEEAMLAHIEKKLWEEAEAIEKDLELQEEIENEFMKATPVATND